MPLAWNDPSLRKRILFSCAKERLTELLFFSAPDTARQRKAPSFLQVLPPVPAVVLLQPEFLLFFRPGKAVRIFRRLFRLIRALLPIPRPRREAIRILNA